MNEYQPDREEDDIARLLRAAGPREQLPDELKRSWEQVFRAELAKRTTRRVQRRRVFMGALAAGIAALALGLWNLRPAGHDTPLISISAVSGAIDIAGQRAAAGRRIAAGTRIDTGDGQRIAIAWAGYDLRIDARSQVVPGNRGIELHRGRIYASDSGRDVGGLQLVISTPAGEIRDIGTQFTVVVQEDATVASVRRGAILVDTGTGQFQTRAESDAAVQVSVGGDNRFATRQVPPVGGEWNWIYAVTPGYEIEGRSAHEFLRWVSGQSGARLEFSSAAAELNARRTTLHGNARQTNPEEALMTVLEATDLLASLEGDALRVSLRR